MQIIRNPYYWGENQEPVSNSEQQRIVGALTSCGIEKISLSGYTRTNPDWDYYIDTENSISIVRIPVRISYSFKNVQANLKSLVGINDVIIFPEGKSTRNSVQKKRLAFAKKLARAVTGYTDNKFLIVPIDSDLIVIWHEYLIRLPASTGYPLFLRERDRIIQRRNREAFVVNDEIRFEWATKIDDEEFEQFVAELLSREPGVARVRKVSAGREQDRGRDLMVDWYLPSPNPDGAYERYRFVVQCKAYSKSVNKSNVQDIRDTVDRHKANGYLLVVSSSLTTSLFDYLDDLRSRHELLVDWWTRTEIEDRIRRNPDLLKRFSKIIMLFRT